MQIFFILLAVFGLLKQEANLCYKVGAPEEQQQYVRMASLISGNDLRFLAVLEAENGKWTLCRQSDVWKNGRREDSWGFGQIHRPSHPDLVNDPRFFSDPVWQLQETYRLYKTGTTFYGARNAYKTKDRFRCP